MIFNQDVINNFFYIILSIFFIFFLVEKIRLHQWYARAATFVSFSIAIILCMLSPIYQNQYCVHDLRMIPFVLGILYSGPVTGFALLVVLLVSRTMIYSWSAVAFVIYVVIFVLTVAAMKWFRFSMLASRNKILFSVVLFTVHSILAALIAKAMTVFVIDKSYFINFILLPSVGMLILTYISETLLKQMQIKQALVKIEKMEVLSQLAASISHEVKNPLTVIKGFLRLLNQDNLPPGKKEQYLKIASSELNRAEEIIDDYLTFAKPDPEQVESISIAEQLHKLADMVEPLSNQQSVLVQKQIDDATILGNTRSFQQAFLNIIKNAIESMPEGGELTIGSEVRKGNVHLLIKDTGMGMTPEQKARLGEPYFSTKEKGTGLGLMVSYRIIEAMGGSISVESRVSKGTSFHIVFPLN
ncbi:sensor histidine kinase [Bacillus sp. KH172YL63]|uniref:sensor histidine kinase n=1 Tax=Bacillus sp. KH172YL63 TaxID=2709784 RepID=UPI0013E44CC3|nr:HAMP domain-containing sensor histidine kinase [Bacillus sp. KH172YL63]BCB02831.1 sensor histidine kinase [Bacillus sp. KH172YL63]